MYLPTDEEVLIIALLYFRFRSFGIRALFISYMGWKLTIIVFSIIFGSISRYWPSFIIPTLFTTIPISYCYVFLISYWICFESDISTTNVSTFMFGKACVSSCFLKNNFLYWISAIRMLKPNLANYQQYPYPIPSAAPVIKT